MSIHSPVNFIAATVLRSIADWKAEIVIVVVLKTKTVNEYITSVDAMTAGDKEQQYRGDFCY